MPSVVKKPLVWAAAAALAWLLMSPGALRALVCLYEPDGPDCPCFDHTGAWDPHHVWIQDIAQDTVGTRESCTPDNGGKPYYQMVIGTTSETWAEVASQLLSLGVPFDEREEWCSETVSFWHYQNNLPYPGGYRNTWYHDWKNRGVGAMETWYRTEAGKTKGLGRWIAGEEVTYEPFELGVTVPVPGAYVAIRAYDDVLDAWKTGDDARTHSLMIDEMWVYRDIGGEVCQVEVTLLEGNSGSEVHNDRRWDDILDITPQGSESLGTSKRKIYGFGIDLEPAGTPYRARYDPSRLHEVEVWCRILPAYMSVTPRDEDREGYGKLLLRFRDYAEKARMAGGPVAASLHPLVKATRLPDGRTNRWIFPRDVQGPVTVGVDLLDVHPLPVTGIVLTWAPGFFPKAFDVRFSEDGEKYANAVVPDLSNAVGRAGVPMMVPVAFTTTGKGVPVRYVEFAFPGGAFPSKATLREIAFRYEDGPWADAADNPVPQRVDVDIKPGVCPNTLNVGGTGTVTVAIAGRDDFDVRTIDPASVRLESVAPAGWSYRDAATAVAPHSGRCGCTTNRGDRRMDLVLRFPIPALAANLGPVQKNEVRALRLTGALGKNAAAEIEGQDCVTLKVPKKVDVTP
jgi:hypothetical protein